MERYTDDDDDDSLLLPRGHVSSWQCGLPVCTLLFYNGEHPTYVFSNGGWLLVFWVVGSGCVVW